MDLLSLFSGTIWLGIEKTGFNVVKVNKYNKKILKICKKYDTKLINYMHDRNYYIDRLYTKVGTYYERYC